MKTYHWLLLLIAAFAGAFCGYQAKDRSSSGLRTDTIYSVDTLVLQAPAVIKEIPVPMPVDVDTAAILAAYHTQRVYNDPVISTPVLHVEIVDTVYQNLLMGRSVSYQIKQPVFNNALSFGLSVAPHHTFLNVGYRHKRTELMAGYDVFNKAVMMSAKYDFFRW